MPDNKKVDLNEAKKSYSNKARKLENLINVIFLLPFLIHPRI